MRVGEVAGPGRVTAKAAAAFALAAASSGGRPSAAKTGTNQLGDTDAINQTGDGRAARMDAAQAAEHSIQETDGF